MIRRSWTQVASIEETLALWAASLREIKKRIRPLFTQERVATNAGMFEIRRIAIRLARKRIQPAHIIAWSLWRRAHQAAAQRAHFKSIKQL
jgi:hypothetical protein